VIMGRSEKGAGLLMGLTMLVAVLVIPGMKPLVNRVGLRGAMLGSMALMGLVLVLFAGIGLYPVGSPLLQGAVLLGLAGIPMAGWFVVPKALVAEVIDVDEQHTGRRREAMYYGVLGFLEKSSLGLAALLTTSLLPAFGYSAAN